MADELRVRWICHGDDMPLVSGGGGMYIITMLSLLLLVLLLLALLCLLLVVVVVVVVVVVGGMYSDAIEKGCFQLLKRTEGISTTNIMQRLINRGGGGKGAEDFDD